MDVLTHVNESNTTVWNVRHKQPKLLQEIRISFMNKIRKSEDCADVARLWKLNYQILRDMCTNAKKNFILNLRHIYSDEEVLVLAYESTFSTSSHKISSQRSRTLSCNTCIYAKFTHISLHLNLLQKLEIKKHRLHS